MFKNIIKNDVSKKDCLFCDIVDKKIKARIIEENDLALAFLDINPFSNGHILVIPKKHSKNLSSTDDESLIAVSLMTKKVSNYLQKTKLDPWGINYLSNENTIAGQVVFHYHMHIIPKYGKNEGFIYDTKNKGSTHSLDEVFEIINDVKIKEKK